MPFFTNPNPKLSPAAQKNPDQSNYSQVREASDPITPTVSAWSLFLIWCGIGAQSFGGGPTTILLISHEMLHKRGWFEEQTYNNIWTLCTLAPGLNLLAFALILGQRLAGWRGSLACLIGMLLPSATITTLLTAGFVSIQNWSPFQAILHGVIPAVIGLSFLFAVQFARPLIKESWREGKTSLTANLLFTLVCAVLLGVFKLSAVLVLLIAAIAGMLIFPRLSTATLKDTAKTQLEAEVKVKQ
jgi:chromate transporter